MSPSERKDRYPSSSPLDSQDKGGDGSVDERLMEDAEWLSSLSESELDLLISLKKLVIRRAKTAGHAKLAEKFDLRTFRALGIVLLEHFKENAKRASIIPDNPEVLRLFDDCPLANTKTSTSPAACSEGVSRSSCFITPIRKRLWEGLREEGQSSCMKKRTKKGK